MREIGPSTLFVLAALFSLSLGTAWADQFLPASGGWQTYVNDRFGMRLDYPVDVFSPEAPPENGDGRTFKAGDATLQTFAFHNIENETPASLKRRLVGTEGYDDVTYSPRGQTWLVLSGFRGDRIFYEKYSFDDGVISAFGVEFPADEKPYFAPIIERIEDSFRAGRSD
jgi:hypothetical protein